MLIKRGPPFAKIEWRQASIGLPEGNFPPFNDSAGNNSDGLTEEKMVGQIQVRMQTKR